MSRRPFDGFEVHLVAEFHANGQPYSETIDTVEEYENEREEANFFYYTTYGHRGWQDQWGGILEDGGAEALADFPSYRDALDLAYALADGKPVTDMVPEGLENVGTPHA